MESKGEELNESDFVNEPDPIVKLMKLCCAVKCSSHIYRNYRVV